MDGPYAQLHVYRLDGRLESRAAIVDAHFLGHWLEGGTSCLFFSEPADEAVAGLLRLNPLRRVADRTSMPYAQWQGPIGADERVGPFRILPSWAPPAAHDRADPLSLVLDPGVVFGAGNHPTTRDCLLAIDQARPSARSRPPWTSAPGPASSRSPRPAGWEPGLRRWT